MTELKNLFSFRRTVTADHQTHAGATEAIGDGNQHPFNLFSLASEVAAKVEDGYIYYTVDGVRRGALVINLEIGGVALPMIHHADDGESDPVGVLLNNMDYEYLGDFAKFVLNPENMVYFLAIGRLVPASLNGIGFLQAISMAKAKQVAADDKLGVRRAVKEAIEFLSK